MIPPPPTSTLFPYTTLFRSDSHSKSSLYTTDRRRRRQCGETSNESNHPDWDSTLSCDWPLSVLRVDRKSTRLNSSHQIISYAVFCLKKKKKNIKIIIIRKYK